MRSTELIETAALYAIIGLLHLVVRGSMGDRLAAPAARYRRWPDFLFHASLAVVLTCAVAIGGVLVAFSYLIVPAIVATLWSKSMTARLVTGWIAGTIVSAAGIALAYLLDLPAGAAIVCASSIVLATAAGMRVVGRGAR